MSRPSETDIRRLERYERMAANVQAHAPVRAELERRCQAVRRELRRAATREGLEAR